MTDSNTQPIEVSEKLCTPSLSFKIFDIIGYEAKDLRKVIESLEFFINSISDSDKKWHLTKYAHDGLELIYCEDGAELGYRYPIDLNPQFKDLADFLVKRVSVINPSDIESVILFCRNEIFDDDIDHCDKLILEISFQD